MTLLAQSRVELLNITHFICIPLATASSKPRLQKSLEFFRTHPAAARIPSKALYPIDTLHLNLQIAMSLPTPDRLANAKTLLETLHLGSLTRELSKPSLRQRSVQEMFSELERSLSLPSASPTHEPFPLRLTLSGLSASIGNDHKARNLRAQCHDPTSRVRHLSHNLGIIFAAAGLNDLNAMIANDRILFKSIGLPTPHVRLMNLTLIQSPELVPSRRWPGRLTQKRHPGIESQELVRDFKDFVWADNIILEKLSLCRLGLLQGIRRAGPYAQLTEVCSVPLVWPVEDVEQAMIV